MGEGKGAVKVALVGCGFSATFHAENYARVWGVDVQLVGAASDKPEQTKAFAAKHGLARAYGSVEEAIADPAVDLIDLCVPNRLHEPLAVAALRGGKHVVVEKPLTAHFGDGRNPKCGVFHEDAEAMWASALGSADRMVAAAREAGRHICYAENWVYAPSVQKANALLAQSDTTILRMVGEESHSGTHSEFSKHWQFCGGGALFNKGCHPLGAALYLKRQEGLRRSGRPIRPTKVTAQIAQLTHIESFQAEAEKYLQTGWVNCEDWGTLLLTFEDGAVAMITAADTVLGGIANSLTVYASKATIHCKLVPVDAVFAYTPDGKHFGEEYLREKAETKTGWQYAAPDEDFFNGFAHELSDFCQAVRDGRAPASDGQLGRDVVEVGYGAYVAAQTGRAVRLGGAK